MCGAGKRPQRQWERRVGSSSSVPLSARPLDAGASTRQRSRASFTGQGFNLPLRTNQEGLVLFLCLGCVGLCAAGIRGQPAATDSRRRLRSGSAVSASRLGGNRERTCSTDFEGSHHVRYRYVPVVLALRTPQRRRGAAGSGGSGSARGRIDAGDDREANQWARRFAASQWAPWPPSGPFMRA